MKKQANKRRTRAVLPKKTEQSMEAQSQAEQELTATPAYRRAKTLVGIASTIGMAVIALRATRRHFWGNDTHDEDDVTDDN